MKKINMLLTVICLCFITSTGFAMRYTISNANFSIEVPNSFRVITDTSTITEDECKDFHMTRTEILNMMHSGIVYLYGIDNDSHMMIQGMRTEDSFFVQVGDLRNVDKETLDQIKNQLIRSVFESKGVQTNEITEYTNADAKYVVAEGIISTPDMKGEKAVARMFVTVTHGRMYMYSITYGYAEQLTPQQRKACQNIIDSVEYY